MGTNFPQSNMQTAEYPQPGTKPQDASLNLFSADQNSIVNQFGEVLSFRKHTITAGLKLIPSKEGLALAGDNSVGTFINGQIHYSKKFFAVQLEVENWDTVNPLNVDSLWAAPSPVHQTPTNGSLSFVLCTVNGSTSFSVPAATTVGGKTVKSSVLADVAFVTAVERTDIPGGPYLLRTCLHMPASVNQTVHPYLNGAANAGINNNQFNPGFNVAATSGVASLGGIIGSGFSTIVAGNVQNPINGLFYSGDALIDIAIFGDSLSQGAFSTGDMNGFGNTILYESFKKGIPINVVNHATAGTNTSNSRLILRSVIAKYKPKYALFKAISPNNTPTNTQATFDTAWGECLDNINFCKQNGVEPIVTTCTGFAGTAWALVAAQNARVMSLPSSIRTVDIATPIMDPNNPGFILALYNSGDSIHLNDAGYRVQGLKILSQIFT